MKSTNNPPSGGPTNVDTYIGEAIDDSIIALTSYTDKNGDKVTNHDEILINRPKLTSRLLQLINEARIEYIEQLLDWQNHVENLKKWNGKLPTKEAVVQLNAYMLKEFINLIGEDEPEPTRYGKRVPAVRTGVEGFKKIYRNKLRKELRAKAKQRFGGGSHD